MRFELRPAQQAVVRALLWIWTALILWSSQGMGDMGDTRPVIGYIAVLLASEFLPSRLLRAVIQVLAVLVLIKWEFYPQIVWFDPLSYLRAFGGELGRSARGALQGDLRMMTDGVRTLAFLGVVTFGTLLLQELIYKPLWLMALTVAGEATLIGLSVSAHARDTWETVAFLFVTLLLLLATNLPGLRGVSRGEMRAGPVRQFLTPLLVLSVMAAVGYVIPKPGPSWSAARLERFLAGAAQEPTYGVANDPLGGPFSGSGQVLLRVFSRGPSYYQGNVLSDYTGRSWSTAPGETVDVANGAAIPSGVVRAVGQEAGPYRTLTERVQVVRGEYPLAFGGYQIVRLRVLGVRHPYMIDTGSDAVSAGVLHPGSVYSVTSELPDPSAANLAGVNDGNLAYGLPQYLQLPADFPARDIALARRITAGETGTFARVEAIIRYLQTHERYALSGIPYVPPGRDFVDQFLFVTHKGYCDHFSTALAVLARAVGIPSRWVKGFVMVPPDPKYRGPGYEYLLRGVDAHSWTEIWFQGYGWIPFEATPSFALPGAGRGTAFLSSHAGRVATGGETPAHPGHRWVTVHVRHGLRPFARSAFPVYTPWIAGGLLLAILVVYAGRRTSWRKTGRVRTRTGGLEELAAKFVRLYGSRSPGQTLREFAQACGRPEDEAKDIWDFVEWFERSCYGGAPASGTPEAGEDRLERLARRGGPARRRRNRAPVRPRDAGPTGSLPL